MRACRCQPSRMAAAMYASLRPCAAAHARLVLHWRRARAVMERSHSTAQQHTSSTRPWRAGAGAQRSAARRRPAPPTDGSPLSAHPRAEPPPPPRSRSLLSEPGCCDRAAWRRAEECGPTFIAARPRRLRHWARDVTGPPRVIDALYVLTHLRPSSPRRLGLPPIDCC